MAYDGYDISGLDSSKDIIQLAKQLEIDYFGINKVNYINKSMFEIDMLGKTYDLCYSVGVLEHFEDDKIVDVIKKQLNISKKVIIVIPTTWFDNNETIHGDDRFLKLKYWRILINKSYGKIIKEYSYSFKHKEYNWIKFLKKILKPKAYRIFIIEKI